MLCNHHHDSSPSLFSFSKIETLYPFITNSPILSHLRAWQPPFCFLSEYVGYFMREESYSVCLFVTGLFHLTSYPQVYPSEFFISKGIIFFCMYIPHLTYRFIHHKHLGCFCLLAIVNHVAMNMNIQVSFHRPGF